MQQTVNYIEIMAPFQSVFDNTNTLSKWTELFSEYQSVEILAEQEEFRLFKLTNLEGEIWTSERWVHEEECRIYAKRLSPLKPFLSMEIEWFYSNQDGQVTRMVWIQRFIVDPASGLEAEQVARHINQNSMNQMKQIKSKLEATAKAERSRGGRK